MKISNKVSIAVVSASLFLGLVGPIVAHAATSPSLGDAATFSVIAQTLITGTTPSSGISGDVGMNESAASITALTTAMVSGTIYSNPTGNTGGGAPTTLLDADVQPNLSTAYDFLDTGGDNATCTKALTGALGSDTDGQDLGGLSLPPGVYCSAGSYNLTGNLTLTGTTGTWVFKTVSGLTTAVGSSVTGGDPCNVWWRIGSAAAGLGNSSTFVGTIISLTGITFGTSVTLNGRALALGAAVTLNSGGTISGPTCAAAVALSGGVQSIPPVYPLINVTKIPSPLNLPAGPGPVTYTYKVTNIGAVAVSNIEVKDNKCSTVQFVSGDTNKDGLLGLTETWTYNCFKTVSETETNTVTACGSAANVSSSGRICDTAQATVAVGVPLTPPLIHLVKVPSVFILPAGGGAVTYSYTVTNPGTVPLSDVSITDDKCTGLPGRVVGHPGDINKNNLLDPGETFHFTCQTNLIQTTTNIGTATGHANGFTITDTSPATVVVVPPGVVVPKLPNAGLPPYGTSTPLDAALAGGILMMVLTSLAVIQKKRKI
ncbi:MAG: ice-binding family protein [Candidatus Parcubacteria bacterium]|nr:ice-binding family protein [Candidatus Parcubacteria bacterium]